METAMIGRIGKIPAPWSLGWEIFCCQSDLWNPWNSCWNLFVCWFLCLCTCCRGFHVFASMQNYMHISTWSGFFNVALHCVCMCVLVCVWVCVQMEQVVLFKWPPLRRWPVINEWARESGSRDSWLGREGIERERGREKVEVCVREWGKTKRDKEMEKSPRIDKERAREDERKTMEGPIVRDCGSTGVEQYLDQRWRLFLCCHLFFLSSLPSSPLFLFLWSHLAVQQKYGCSYGWFKGT